MNTARRRFWRDVTVQFDDAGNHALALDGKAVRLPAGHVLALPSLALMEAIADEWRAIAPSAPFDAAALPLTRIAGTMIERIAPNRGTAVATLLRYGASDSLFYRDEEFQSAQNALFDPILSAFAERHKVLPAVTTALLPLPVDPLLHDALEQALAILDDAALASLGVLTPALGSLILGLGLLEGWLDEQTACGAAFWEERVQMRHWGEDAEILAQIATHTRDVTDALRFWRLSIQKCSNSA